MRALSSLLAGCLLGLTPVALAPAPASAHIEVTDPIVLPQSGNGDVVRLPGRPVLAIAGGDDSPVVLVDLDTRSTLVVPDSEGVRTLDLDDAGELLHGVSRTPDEVVEIDPAASRVTRRWSVPDGCLLDDVVMRGGSLWFTQGCGAAGLRRLDPTTGAITIEEGVDSETLVGDPGTSQFYGRQGVSVTRYDATADGLAQTGHGSATSRDTTGLRISEDGGTLFTQPYDPLTTQTAAWSLPDLGGPEYWPTRQTALWADQQYIGVRSISGHPALVSRTDQSRVNSFMPEGALGMQVSDVRILDGDAVVTGLVEGEKHVYVVADPLTEEPQLTLKVRAGETGINTPTPVSGTATYAGRPLPSQELDLVQVDPTPHVVATVTTDENGTWNHTWTPREVGLHVLEVRYRGTRDSVDRVRVPVEEIYERIDITGPDSVAGGEEIVMTVTATRNGQPLPDVVVELDREEWSSSSPVETESLGSATTGADGTVTFRTAPEAVDFFRYFAQAQLPYQGLRRMGPHRVDVNRIPTTVTLEPEVTTAAPGDPVPMRVTLSTADGDPIAGETVHITGSGHAAVTTDSRGEATYTDTSTEEGTHHLYATFNGTLTLDDSTASSDSITRSRITTSVEVTGATQGEVGEPVPLSGRVTNADGPVELAITHAGSSDTITTAADGTWSTSVTPTLPGDNRWAIDFAGTTRLAPSQAVHQISTPRLATAIVLNSVSGRVGAPLEIQGRISGLMSAVGVYFWLDGQEVGSQFTDGPIDASVADPLTDAGPHDLTVVFDGNNRHEPSSASTVVEVDKRASSIELEAGPMIDPGDSFEVPGLLSPRVTGQVTFAVEAPSGVERPVTVTVDNGAFLLPLEAPIDTSDAPRWKVTYPGDDDTAPSSTTYTARLRPPHDVTITVSDDQPYIHTWVQVWLTTGDGARAPASVEVHDHAGRLLHRWEGEAGSGGSVFDDKIRSSWRITATVQADEQHKETVETTLIRPTPFLDNALPDGLMTRRTAPYVVHDRGVTPRLLSSATPRSLQACVRRVVQRQRATGWKTVDRRCVRVGGAPVRSRIRVSQDPRERYRVRTVFTGNAEFAPATSGFRYFRFRR